MEEVRLILGVRVEQGRARAPRGAPASGPAVVRREAVSFRLLSGTRDGLTEIARLLVTSVPALSTLVGHGHERTCQGLPGCPIGPPELHLPPVGACTPSGSPRRSAAVSS